MIVAMSHAGKALAIDGRTKATLWQQQFDRMECSNSFAVGHFTDDDIPDFFTTLSYGIWPDYTFAQQVMLDGKDGSVAYRDTLGCFSLASPVVYDLDGDGVDEALFGVNQYGCAMAFTDDVRSPTSIRYDLMVVDFKRGTARAIDQIAGFKSVYATPWVGDVDQDGYLDIVYSQNYNANDLFRYLGMSVRRMSTSVAVKEPSPWGGYMGTASNGLFSLP